MSLATEVARDMDLTGTFQCALVWVNYLREQKARDTKKGAEIIRSSDVLTSLHRLCLREFSALPAALSSAS